MLVQPGSPCLGSGSRNALLLPRRRSSADCYLFSLRNPLDSLRGPAVTTWRVLWVGPAVPPVRSSA
eukprot:scaffold435161_cov36-Prasinocladus_malaysianus.AAC.1